MQLQTRKLLDRAFTGLGGFSIILMGLALIVLLAPIFIKGTGAFIFRETVEHREFLFEKLERGDEESLEAELHAAQQARENLYAIIEDYEASILKGAPPQPTDLTDEQREKSTREQRRELRRQKREYEDFIESHSEELTALHDLEDRVDKLLGPRPGEPRPIMVREQYGQTRWDRARHVLHGIMNEKTWVYPEDGGMGVETFVPRIEHYRGTKLEPMFGYLEDNLDKMLRPQWTFYWGFLTDEGFDAGMLGGIWPAVLGTFYLTLGAMIFAAPLGIIAAIYFVEYAGDNWFVSFLRICVSTLAGVPSIVFGLFGLAFLINTIHVSETKSVLAGALTLALLILPTVIRASEEAIKAVPQTYREASMGLGAGKWRTVTTVVLPASMAGILTGTIISMGRAAGETAPIIFTAAVSLGQPLSLFQTASQPTPALPWNIYHMATEHAHVDEIRHVQYGMVLTLVLLVLTLNLVAIVLRARVAKKLRG